MDDKKKEILEAYETALSAGNEFNKALMTLRSIGFDEPENDDQRTMVLQLEREIDMRSAVLLRSILVQHGNLLFM